MAINSRISISFDQKELMLIFNRVEDATAYKFRVFRRDNLEFIGEFDLKMVIPGSTEKDPLAIPPEYRCDEYYCTSAFESTLINSLERQVSYLLVGEAYAGEYLKKAQAEFITLEESTQKVYEDFGDELEKTDLPNLRSKWRMFQEAIIMPPHNKVLLANYPRWPRGYCISLKFS
jgi:hypothetical protein